MMILLRICIMIALFCCLIACTPASPQVIAYDCPIITLEPSPSKKGLQALNKRTRINDAAKAWVAYGEACMGWNSITVNQINAYNNETGRTQPKE